jgi:hypothetical protein
MYKRWLLKETNIISNKIRNEKNFLKFITRLENNFRIDGKNIRKINYLTLDSLKFQLNLLSEWNCIRFKVIN